jgi:hypothetical protein
MRTQAPRRSHIAVDASARGTVGLTMASEYGGTTQKAL